MLGYATAGSIILYQRWVSPRKGYCCAYRRLTGRFSCSEYGRRIALRAGALAFARGLPRQFERCRRARAILIAQSLHSEPDAAPHAESDDREQRRKGRKPASASSSSDCGSSGVGDCTPDLGIGDCTPDIGACDIDFGYCSW
ncbi:membrane protein insertion efficiency factor YidD [Terrirubrum flagellatum]|uniref:membrane protein insertion efficiency factor YidD n=1 Tax=Terrirubrum flagellatum TaxID=2895980 RepID=UPI003CC81AB7